MFPYILSSVLCSVVIVLCLYFILNYKIEGDFVCTYIYIFQYDEKGSISLTKDRFDATFCQFYNQFHLEDVFYDKDINQSVATYRSESMSYRMYAKLLKKKLMKQMPRYESTTDQPPERFVFSKLAEFSKVAETFRNSNTLITCDRDFLEYKNKLHSLLRKILKEAYFVDKKTVRDLNDALDGHKLCIFNDYSYNKNDAEDNYFKFDFYLGEKKQESKENLLSHLADIDAEITKRDNNHYILDLTFLCLDKIAHTIKVIKSKKDFEQRNILVEYKNEIFSDIEDLIIFTLEAISKMKYCKNKHITIVFDIFLILEIAIARNCPDRTYTLISASVKEILSSILEVVNSKKEKHGKYALKVLDIKDLMKLKLLSHFKTQLMVDKLKHHIERNSSANPNMLVELKKLTNFDKASRWYFDGSLFDSLVNSESSVSASKDIDRLVAICNNNSKLIINTCFECNGKGDDFCKYCAELINHFQHVCLLSRYYRSLLVRKTQLYYYQNIDDLVKYGREDEETALQNEQNIEHDDKAKDVFVERSDVQSLEKSDVEVESKVGFEHSKSGVTRSKRNKMSKDPTVRKVKTRPVVQ